MLTVKELLKCIQRAKDQGFCDDNSLVVINVNGRCRYAKVAIVEPDSSDDLFISCGKRPDGTKVAAKIAELLSKPSDECESDMGPGQWCGRRPVVAACHDCTEALCEQHAIRCLRCDRWFCQDCCGDVTQEPERCWLCKGCREQHEQR